MIQECDTSQGQQAFKKKFRRTGPLDAYIYQNRDDTENIEETHDNVLVNHTIPTLSLPSEQKSQITHIFTDGACTSNGKRGANAAWGYIIVSDADRRVLVKGSGAIPKSEPQTNQRAELQALLRGLEAAETYPGFIKIWSDSQYAINCASVWGPSWKRKSWTKPGGPIQHLDLIKQIVDRTARLGYHLEYKWVKGHKGGDAQYQFPWMFNHQVDALATAALA